MSDDRSSPQSDVSIAVRPTNEAIITPSEYLGCGCMRTRHLAIPPSVSSKPAIWLASERLQTYEKTTFNDGHGLLDRDRRSISHLLFTPSDARVNAYRQADEIAKVGGSLGSLYAARPALQGDFSQPSGSHQPDIDLPLKTITRLGPVT